MAPAPCSHLPSFGTTLDGRRASSSACHVGTALGAPARQVTWGEILTTQGYLKSLLVGGGLVVAQQITGQPSVLYFATSIFQNAGFSSLDEASKVRRRTRQRFT